MITIVDYDTGNIQSVKNAFQRLGIEYRMSSDPMEIAKAEKIFLPGVGEMSTAMEKLRERRLIDVLKNSTVPMLGICLGMQLMCAYGEEGGGVEGLGIFDNKVLQMRSDASLKVPHVGWNTITNLSSPLFEGINEGAYVYYVHSFAANVNQNTIATTDYCAPFSGSLHRDNFYGCQFHPEKSGDVGEQILTNFVNL